MSDSDMESEFGEIGAMLGISTKRARKTSPNKPLESGEVGKSEKETKGVNQEETKQMTKKELAEESKIKPLCWFTSLITSTNEWFYDNGYRYCLDDVFNILSSALISCPCKDCPCRSMYAPYVPHMCRYISKYLEKMKDDNENEILEDGWSQSHAYRDLVVFLVEIVTRAIEASMLDGTLIDIKPFQKLFPDIVEFITNEPERSSVRATLQAMKRLKMSDYDPESVERLKVFNAKF